MIEIPQEWLDLLRLLPGYDPVATSEGCRFDVGAAQDAIRFIQSRIRHVEGDKKGQPFLLEPWQKSFVANLFGWKKIDSLGREVRRYREALLFLPRKNGKTPLAAAIALYVFFCDKEPGAQCYVAAESRDQAGKLFRQAKGMVEAEKVLWTRSRIYGGTAQAGQAKSIVLMKDEASFLQVIAADASTQHGGNTHLAVIDELHAQPNRDLVDVLTSSMSSLNRKQPLLIYITTADFNRPSICNEIHKRAQAVRDNGGDPAKPGYDPAFLPAIWEASNGDDWTDPEIWKKVNPNLGVSKSVEYMQREVGKAKENPAEENKVKRLDLNVKTETDTRAIPMEKWDSAAPADPLSWRKEMLAKYAGRECWAGLDLGSTSDLTALALLFREGSGYVTIPYFWAPKEGARKRERRDRVPYETWAKLGYITLTDGDVTDYSIVRRDINRISRQFFLRDIAADRWNATQIVTELQGDGANIVAYGQGFRDMAAPTKALIELVITGQLQHGGNPVLRWMASNASTETDAAGNLKFSKKKSTEKIDGIIAVTMSLGRLLADGGTVYDSRGILSLGGDDDEGSTVQGLTVEPATEPAITVMDLDGEDDW